MATKNVSHVGAGSIVGAVVVGDNSYVSATVNQGSQPSTSLAMTQEEHKAAIKRAQLALVNDQDEVDDLLREALHQFLRIAREIQVEQANMTKVQAQMKETLDEVWAAQAVKGMKPQLLPKTLELAQALLAHPAMAEVVKTLIAS